MKEVILWIFLIFVGDNFVACDFMNDDSFGDSLKGQLDEPLNGESECNNEPDQTELHDDGFKLKNAFIQGGAMGFGYGEGLRERKRRK